MSITVPPPATVPAAAAGTVSPPASAVPRSLGLYLAGVQFLFALSWVVYVIYLPALVERAGLPRSLVPWLLLLDQLLFIVCDAAVGSASDRALRVLGRLGAWIAGATLLSMAAFVALPWLAPGSGPLLVVLTLVWVASASLLRAPPLALLGRHAARPAQPGLLALVMLGGGLAAALAPYLGLQLKGTDPRLPFVLVSLALAAATLGMARAERVLAGRGGAPAPAAVSPPVAGSAGAPLVRFLAAVLLAAVAFQLHAQLLQGPLYLRLVAAPQLPWLLPVYWVGFNLMLWPAARLVQRRGAATCAPVAAVGAAAATVLAWGTAQGGLLAALAAAQALGGLCWAVLLVALFTQGLALGQGGREGRMSGALNALLAAAALTRLATATMLSPTPAALAEAAAWPALGFAAAALLLWRGKAGGARA